MNKLNRDSLSIKFIIVGLLLSVICWVLLIVNNNNIIYAIIMSLCILSLAFLIIGLSVISKRICAMILSISWVFLFTVFAYGIYNYSQYISLNSEIKDDYLVYKEETEDFYKEKTAYLKSLGAIQELAPFENKKKLLPFEYIAMGYNLQVVELLKGFVDEMSNQMYLKEGLSPDKKLIKFQDIKDSYDGVISNSKFDFINYVFSKLGTDITADNFSEDMKSVLNYDNYKDSLYLDKVNQLAVTYKNSKMIIFGIVPLIVLTCISYLVRENWIVKEY